MKVLACPATRRLLHAFHDEELPISDQIAVGAHLEWCESCASAFADLRRLREALRALTPGREALSHEEEISLQATVVNRIKAERSTSWTVEIREMFEDMHLVYAAGGAVLAAVVCVVVMFSIMQFATGQHPDSFAAMVRLAAPPGSNQNPVKVDGQVRMPRALDEPFASASSVSGDTAFMLAAVVTREGTIANLELLTPATGRVATPGTDEAKAMAHLLGAVARARFEPARVAGLPVAVNMVWLVTQTTVRASLPLGLTGTPAAKKRTASLTAPPPRPVLA